MEKEIKKFTAEDLYNEVNFAIMTVMSGGQRYKIGSRELTRADLKQLIAFRNQLMIEMQNNSGNLLDHTYIAYFTGR